MEKRRESLTSEGVFSKGRSDVTLMFVVLFLMAFGIIMIYSSSYYFSFEKFGNHGHFFVRQMMWVGLGTILMYVVSRVNYRFIVKFSVVIYIVVFALLIIVLMMPPLNGARRWIVLGGMQFQPSELAKVSVILALAVMIDGFDKHINKFKVLAIVILVALVPVLLIGVENLSTAIVVTCITGGMVFCVYRNIPKLVLIASPPVLAMAGYIFMQTGGYRSARFDIWLNGPFSDPLGDGFQTIQSLYAIGSGGFFWRWTW